MGTSLKADNFIYPYFVIEGKNKKQEIKAFPDVFRFSLDRLLKDIEELEGLGINKILLFGIPSGKDRLGSGAYKEGNIVAEATKQIKAEFPGLTILTDVCLCAYTTHGHCGIIKPGQRKIDHRATISALSKMALSHAEAGADYVAPSAMARGQVFAIRKRLDKNGFKRTKILGYSAKFASNFYGPFREVAHSSPAFGDRSTYQLAYKDSTQALKKIEDDINEGADIVMVKPALGYLDIIKEASTRFGWPLAAYNVSGEYAMIKNGAKLGLWDEKKAVFEIITSIKRAGADFVITYHAKDIVKWLKIRN